MPRNICPTCDGRMDVARDPDEWAEYSCPAERACEHPGCGLVTCGDDAPTTCDLCAFHFCAKHLQRTADYDTCAGCVKEVFPQN